MEIIHRISGNSSESGAISALARTGVSPSLGEILFVFEIGELDPKWAEVCALVKRYELLDIVSTKFRDIERSQADFLKTSPAWHHGYPQPQDDFRSFTYNLEAFCARCGTGARQVAPFRITAEPKWGQRSVLQLNWVFDEFFVTPLVWTSVFEPMGIDNGPVLHHKTGKVLETVVQLVVQAESSIDTKELPYEDCSECGRRKYLPPVRGFAPKPLDPLGAAFKSKDDFGSGASANKLLMVSNSLYKSVKESGIKGVDFIPCAN